MKDMAAYGEVEPTIGGLEFVNALVLELQAGRKVPVA